MCRSRHLPVLQKHAPTHQPTHLASRLLRVQLRSRRSLRLQLGTLAHALCKVERCRIGWNVGRASSAARCRAGRPPCEQAALRVVAAAKCRQSITAPYDSCPAPCPSFTHNTHTPCGHCYTGMCLAASALTGLALALCSICVLEKAHSPALPLPFFFFFLASATSGSTHPLGAAQSVTVPAPERQKAASCQPTTSPS